MLVQIGLMGIGTFLSVVFTIFIQNGKYLMKLDEHMEEVQNLIVDFRKEHNETIR